jgi:hypothetical protein
VQRQEDWHAYDEELTATSLLSTDDALEALPAFEALVRQSQDAIMQTSDGAAADFIGHVWLVADALAELDRATIDPVRLGIEHTLAWQQLDDETRQRWGRVSALAVRRFEETTPEVRRRWCRHSVVPSLGSTPRYQATSFRASGYHRTGPSRAAPGWTGPSGSFAALGRRADGGALERTGRRLRTAHVLPLSAGRLAPRCRASGILAGAPALCRRACGPQRPPEPGSGLPGRTAAVSPAGAVRRRLLLPTRASRAARARRLLVPGFAGRLGSSPLLQCVHCQSVDDGRVDRPFLDD